MFDAVYHVTQYLSDSDISHWRRANTEYTKYLEHPSIIRRDPYVLMQRYAEENDISDPIPELLTYSETMGSGSDAWLFEAFKIFDIPRRKIRCAELHLHSTDIPSIWGVLINPTMPPRCCLVFTKHQEVFRPFAKCFENPRTVLRLRGFVHDMPKLPHRHNVSTLIGQIRVESMGRSTLRRVWMRKEAEMIYLKGSPVGQVRRFEMEFAVDFVIPSKVEEYPEYKSMGAAIRVFGWTIITNIRVYFDNVR